MGLDNGIIIRFKSKEAGEKFIEELNKYYLKFQLESYEEKLFEQEYKIELCYWRKCWNVRSVFITNLVRNLGPENKEKFPYSYPLEKDDIPPIARELQSLFGQKEWEEPNESIWEWEEYKAAIFDDYVKLFVLYRLFDELDIEEVYFYDSY